MLNSSSILNMQKKSPCFVVVFFCLHRVTTTNQSTKVVWIYLRLDIFRKGILFIFFSLSLKNDLMTFRFIL